MKRQSPAKAALWFSSWVTVPLAKFEFNLVISNEAYEMVI